MTDQMTHAFVAGHPIGHSRSPLIHRYWLDEFRLAGAYEPIDVEPGQFRDFIRKLPESRWIGGNVTIPHKELAYEAVDRRDAAAEAIGAVNTVWMEAGKILGANTDAYGFAANLDDQTHGWRDGERALVIGAGGASRAVLNALVQAGFSHIDLANRTVSRAAALEAQFGPTVRSAPIGSIPSLAAKADLIVNTTPMGMAGRQALDLDFAHVPDNAIAADIVYVPLRTPFLAAAGSRGLRTADGLGMLLHQAVPGFERWFGKKPTVTRALYQHIVADIEASTADEEGDA